MPHDIESMHPASGRRILESGGHYNEADYYRKRESSDFSLLSVHGQAFRAFFQGSVPALTTYEFVLDIPAGVDVFGFSRTTTVFDGRLDGTFLVGGSWSSVAYTANGFLFDERGGPVQSQTDLLRVTDLSGAVARTPDVPIISPSTGPTRAASTQTVGGAAPAFNQANPPVFRYFNPGDTEPVEIWLELAWVEAPSA